MFILILHNEISLDDALDDQDTLVQVEQVACALEKMGHKAATFACGLDLSAVKQYLMAQKPDIVFNLVESLDRCGRLIYLVPTLLDAAKITYTGSNTSAIQFSSNKLTAKELLINNGIPTPEWTRQYPDTDWSTSGLDYDQAARLGKQWIIKSVWEHASIGIDEHSLIRPANGSEFIDKFECFMPDLGDFCFAEQYIDGREFNLSILETKIGPVVLNPAEIIFEDYPPEKPRVVGYKAKWENHSFEYSHTVRCFNFSPNDLALINRLKEIAMNCWNIFKLSGYARVDFRIDQHGTPFVLEVNTNPCLTKDAGFAAALEQSAIPYENAIDMIITAACNKNDFKKAAASKHQQNAFPLRSTEKKTINTILFRDTPIASDEQEIKSILTETNMFYPYEVDVGVELIQDRLMKGDASDYHFIFTDSKSRLIGFSCYGAIPCTDSAFDIYWIAVQPEFQKMGLGNAIMVETENSIRRLNGTRIYVETSYRDQYINTRRFYERNGYSLMALIPDFYAPRDHKAIYGKFLS